MRVLRGRLLRGALVRVLSHIPLLRLLGHCDGLGPSAIGTIESDFSHGLNAERTCFSATRTGQGGTLCSVALVLFFFAMLLSGC